MDMRMEYYLSGRLFIVGDNIEPIGAASCFNGIAENFNVIANCSQEFSWHLEDVSIVSFWQKKGMAKIDWLNI